MGSFFGARLLKPLILAAVTYLAIRYITGNATQGALVALIPLILGMMNIFANIGYGLAALSVIAAVGWAVAPQASRLHIAAEVYRTSGVTLATAPQARSK